MQWVMQLYKSNPTAHAIAVLAAVCVFGLGLGGIRARGIKLGTSGVLFAGIITGFFYEPIDYRTLEFVKELGLILFVFCIGLQLGPGFVDSLRISGLRLNLLALAIVLLGVVTSVGLGWLLKIDRAAVLGVFSGATTNTPSLGAAQQTLASFPDMADERRVLPALAYAVAYPVGVLGIIASLLALKSVFRIDVTAEVQSFLVAASNLRPGLQRRTLMIENADLQGLTLAEVSGLIEPDVVISRIRRGADGTVVIATRDTPLSVGDALAAIGSPSQLDRFEGFVGRSTDEILSEEFDRPVAAQSIVLTQKGLAGKTVRDVQVAILHDVAATTVTRGDVEMVATPDLQLRFGDVLQIFGEEQALNRAAGKLGNSLTALDETHFVPLFAGIGVGILLGTFPVAFPGLPQPLKLGLAGGPLLVALCVGHIGRIGNLVWYMPRNANIAFRELGISLFFASVGLLSGPTFFATACSLDGLKWLLVGGCVTVLPLLLVGAFARSVLALNYVELSGLVAGSMTDPPALAFAGTLCQSESPAVAYASVYPLTMLLRITAAQILAVVLCG